MYATPKDLAAEFQVSPEFVRRKAREGQWPVSKLGNAFRFSPEDQERIRQIVKAPKPEPKPEGIRELVARAS